ncbi:hypothetical protein [Neolewinella persica]|uniref:hypothetical protein n=1 Tax=Neolewinella persica TaxID=70998 RepID=UPI000476BD7D|nr:hypothetical protein [Neolewinella persica]
MKCLGLLFFCTALFTCSSNQKFETTAQYSDSIPVTLDQVIARDQGVRTGDIPGSMQDIGPAASGTRRQVIMALSLPGIASSLLVLSNDDWGTTR